jgi:hypothetical protein
MGACVHVIHGFSMCLMFKKTFLSYLLDLLDIFSFGNSIDQKRIVEKWSLTQVGDFEDQLNSGIRYFDLRVLFDQSENCWKTTHGLYGPKVEVCQSWRAVVLLESQYKQTTKLANSHSGV